MPVWNVLPVFESNGTASTRGITIRCALLFLALFAAMTQLAHAQDLVFFTHETREVVPVSDDPERFASQLPPRRTRAGSGLARFTPVFDDVVNVNGFGFDDPVFGEERRRTAVAALDYLSAVLNEDTGANVEVNFTVSQTDGSGFLAAAGSFYFVGDGFSNGVAFQHITTGVDPSGAIADIQIAVDFGFPLNSDHTRPPLGSELDFYSILLHEFMHGLGLSSLTDQNGISLISGANPGRYSVWDRFLSVGGTQSIWNPTTTALEPGISSATFTSDNLFFSGVEATNTNDGIQPRVYAPSFYQGGSSISHFDPDLFSTVHQSFIMIGASNREFSNVDLGALRDIGYANVELTQASEPEILDQLPVSIPLNGSRAILTSDLIVFDPDNVYPDDHTLMVFPGANYALAGNVVTPTNGFIGTLTIPVTVNDGANSSPVFLLIAAVSDVLPQVTSAGVTPGDATHVLVTFDSDMTNDAALVNPSNYAVTSSLGGLTVSGVVRIDSTSVQLTVATMTSGITYTVTVDTNSITDLGSNFVHPVFNSAVFTYGPTAPRISMTPPFPVGSTNIQCDVIEGSVNQSASVTYTFDWEFSNDGISFSPFAGSFDQPVASVVLSSSTSDNQHWRCTVTATTAEALTSQPVSETVIIQSKAPTTVSNFTLSDNDVQLGESVTASVDVSPSGGRTVSFEVFKEGEAAFHSFVNAANTSGNTFSAEIFLPDAQTETWEIRAFVAESASNAAAASSRLAVDVSTVQAVLLLNTAQASIELGESLNVFGTLGTSPSLPTSTTLPDDHILNQNVKLEYLYDGECVMCETDETVTVTSRTGLFNNTDTNGTGDPTFTPTEPGIWRIRATFLGSTDLRPAAAEVTIAVRATAGYAILVTGKINGESGIDDHRLTMSRVKSNLIATGFDPNNIVEIDPQFNGQSVPDPNELPLLEENIRLTIRDWASREVRKSPAPLYIVLVNHGSPPPTPTGEGAFHIFNSSSTDTITPAELSQWVSAYEGQLGVDEIGVNARKQPVIIVNGFCYSGSFLPALAKSTTNLPRRIVVSSSDPLEESYKGIVENVGGQNVRDGELFVSLFFGQMALGRNLKSSFDSASQSMRRYTENADGNGDRSTTSYLDRGAQHALLDDNGDGAGTHYLFNTPPEQEDGFLSSTLTLGFGDTTNAANITIESVSSSIVLPSEPDTTFPVLTARMVSPNPVNPWIEVKSPTFAVNQNNQSEQKNLDASTKIAPDGGSRAVFDFTWTQTSIQSAADFDVPGRYEILYFGSDSNGELAPIERSFVYRPTSGVNNPPTPFNLLFPSNGATGVRAQVFAWEPTSDPDGDDFTFTLQLTPTDWPGAPGAPSPPSVEITGLRQATYVFPNPGETTPSRELLDDVTYSWTVFAYDFFGNLRQSTSTRTININENSNPQFDSGIAEIIVERSDTRTRITNATVTVGGNVAVHAGNGSYVAVTLPLGQTLGVSVSAPDFTPDTSAAVTTSSTSLVVASVALLPDLVPIDTDQDGLDDSVETNTGSFVDSSNTGTDPNNPDSDGDGFSDGYELQAGVNTDPTSSFDKPAGFADVYVDFNHSGVRWGTVDKPVTSVAAALPLTGVATTIHLQSAGIAPDLPPLTLNQPGKTITLRANAGLVRIGVTFGTRSAQGPVGVSDASKGDSLTNIDGFSTAGNRVGRNANDSDSTLDGDSAGDRNSTEDDETLLLRDGYIFEPVIPFDMTADGQYKTRADGIPALRLRADAPIDIVSLWADIVGNDGNETSVDWVDAEPDQTNDIWVRFRSGDWPLTGELTLESGGVTVDGVTVNGPRVQFEVESIESFNARTESDDEQISQPDDAIDIAHISVDTSSVPALPNGIGSVYRVQPPEVFDEPQWVWIPVPAGHSPHELEVRYYHPNGDERGWYPVSHVLGFMSDDATFATEDDAGAWHIGLRIQHSAILQLRDPVAER